MGASPGVLQGIMGNAGEIERQNILSQQAQQAQAMAPLQQGLAQQQLTAAQQENQLRAIQMKDASIIGMAMQRNPGDFNAALDWAMQNGASAPTILSYRQKQAEMAKTMADTQSLQAGAAEKTSNIATKEDEAYDTALGAALRQSKQEGWNPLELRKNFDIQASMNPNPRVGQRLRAFIAGIPQDPTAAQQYLEGGYAKTGAAKQEAEMAKEAAQQKQAEAETALATAKTPGATAESAIQQFQANALKGSNAQSRADAIDAVIPNNAQYGPLNQRTKGLVEMALQNGAKPETIQAIVKDAADQIGRTETAVATAKATEPIKINVAAAEQGIRNAAATPTDAALDIMAEDALNGKTPSSRNPVLIKKVWDRAAELASQRGMNATQVLMQRNSAQAAQGAFNSITKQYETLKPFADMAEKNADVLEKAAASVTNLGAPILNTPVRELESKFAGNTDVARFHAALMPVQADFARILNSPTGGGILSDTARGEMQAAIGPGATPGQIKAALDVFRNDAKNRRESYEASLKDLGQRAVNAPENKPAATPAAPAAPRPTATNAKGEKVEWDGKAWVPKP